MRYKYSPRSKTRLAELDPRLQLIMRELIKHMDVTITTGHRTKAQQEEKYAQGFSRVQWPDSAHNKYPAEAVDVEPWPLDYEDVRRYYLMAGMVKAIASQHGVRLRWGGDWDGDNVLTDQRFDDLAHFELEDSNGD